jgi:hypothetical protein
MSRRMLAAASLTWTIGAWLRVHGLQAMEFKADERTSLELAIQFIEAHPWSSAAPWPSHGMLSSNGVGNAPLMTWIVAPLWAVTHHPVGVAGLIAVINALCLIPLWLWALRKMDEHRALLTLAIASVSPFAVLFSRKIWPVDLLLPGLLAVLWSIEWLRDGRVWRAVALAGVGVLLISQLHQSGLITVPLLIFALAIQWIVDVRRGVVTRFSRPSIAEIVAVALAIGANLFLWWTYLPYLLTVPAEVYANRPRAPSFEPQLLLNVMWEIVPREVVVPFFDDRYVFRADPIRWVLYYASLALGAPLAVYGLWRWLRAPLALPVVGVWWWLIIAVFTFARIPSHHYYVLAVMPLPILLAAGAFDGRLGLPVMRGLLAWRWLYVVGLAALTLITGAWLINRGGSRSDYGVSFEIQEHQARALLARDRGEPRALDRSHGEVTEISDAQTCHPVSKEVVWIAGWIEGRTRLNRFSRFAVCDGWVESGDGILYRWTIRAAP